MIEQRKFLLRYAVLGVLLVVLDLVSKDAIEENLADGSVKDLLPFLRLGLVYNQGAAFGFLADASGWQLPFFMAVAIIISVVIIVRLVRAAGTEKWFEVALVLILSGAIGNLVDRVRVGYVVDFVQFYYGAWQFPAFNVADTAIFFGVSMVILDVLGVFPRREPIE